MPVQGVPEAPHARGEPALSAAGRPQARAAGHGQDGGAGDRQPARLGLLGEALAAARAGADANAMSALIQKLLQRWRRCGGAVAETGAHDGTASTSERLVHTHAGVQHAAKIRGAAHEQARDALGV